MSDQALGSLGRESCFLDKSVEWSLISVYAVSLVLGALLLSLALGFLRWAWGFFLAIKSYSCSALHLRDRHYASTLILKASKKKKKEAAQSLPVPVKSQFDWFLLLCFLGYVSYMFPLWGLCCLNVLACWLGRKWSITKQSFELTFIILSPVENALMHSLKQKSAVYVVKIRSCPSSRQLWILQCSG